jgi:hypothetical protein
MEMATFHGIFHEHVKRDPASGVTIAEVVRKARIPGLSVE